MKLHLKIIAVTLFVGIIFSTSVSNAHAQYFGGLGTFAIPCTCGGSGPYTLYFTPLYFTSVPMAGPLTVPFTPLTFAYYNLRPGTWGLGTYVPAGGICLLGVPPYCFPTPSLGLILPFTGSSLTP